MDTVAETIEAAREALGRGRDKRAADLLTSAAVECRDPVKAAMILNMATDARKRAGWLTRRRWDDVIRISEQRQVPQPAE